MLREEGIRVSLINSNPATIMTDPEFADATYVEPINAEFVEKVLADQAARGFPVDAVLATLGGQTALNTAIALDERGVLEKYGVELIGADIPAINRGEDRQIFKDVVRSVGGDVPRSAVATRWTRSAPRSPISGCRWWSGRPSPWAVSAPEWPTPSMISSGSPAAGWPRRRPRSGRSE